MTDFLKTFYRGNRIYASKSVDVPPCNSTFVSGKQISRKKTTLSFLKLNYVVIPFLQKRCEHRSICSSHALVVFSNGVPNSSSSSHAGGAKLASYAKADQDRGHLRRGHQHPPRPHVCQCRQECEQASGTFARSHSGPYLDDLFIWIWISVMIICLTTQITAMFWSPFIHNSSSPALTLISPRFQ